MRFPPIRRALVVVLVLVAALSPGLQASGVAAADDPVFIGWSELAPGLTAGYDPTSENLCVRGDVRCVDAVIREMDRRLRRDAKACSHNAIFALAYLRTTEEYRRAVTDPSFFNDTPFVNHEVAVFAAYYFDAYDDWYGGKRGRVPPAWRIAFQAADDRAVSASGNMLLGMSAHINRDLPFVLAAIGLVAPDGSSRKPDHDKVNVFLNRVGQALLAEGARRFDPTFDDGDVPGTTVDNTVVFQPVPAWREEAWRNAERLVLARTPQEHALVADSIEEGAATKAQALHTASAYTPLSGSAARDAYCAEHWNDA